MDLKVATHLCTNRLDAVGAALPPWYSSMRPSTAPSLRGTMGASVRTVCAHEPVAPGSLAVVSKPTSSKVRELESPRGDNFGNCAGATRQKAEQLLSVVPTTLPRRARWRGTGTAEPYIHAIGAHMERPAGGKVGVAKKNKRTRCSVYSSPLCSPGGCVWVSDKAHRKRGVNSRGYRSRVSDI